MQYINLTPHPINLFVDGKETILPRSGMIARCEETTEVVAVHDGVEWRRPAYGRLYCVITEEPFAGDEVSFPQPFHDTAFVVSGIALAAAKALGRTDCVSPHGFIRDAEGRILGCTGFSV